MNNISLVPQEPIVDITNRDSLIAWLTWNDWNGCYTDIDCDNENLPRLTLELAINIYFDQLEG